VRDVGDVDALGDDELHDRVTQQVAGHRDGNRAEAGDLAHLVTRHGAAA